MRLSDQQIIGLPVYTQSDEHLGKVSQIILNIDTGQLVQIEVVSSSIIKFFAKNLLVSKDQIISITEDKVVVEDSVKKTIEAQEAKGRQVISEAIGSAMNKELKT